MIQIPKRWEQWVKTLVGSAIGGGANTALASLGPGVAASVGVHIRPFEPAQMWDMFASGAIIGALMFLAKSPVPPDPTVDTTTLTTTLTKTTAVNSDTQKP